MLSILRKKGVAKKVLWVIAIVIIISFGFFGAATRFAGTRYRGARYAGKIFGKNISFDDFDKAYKNTRIQALKQYGPNLDKVAPMIDLVGQTWDRMILLHEADKRKIRIPNETVVQAIQQDPSFKRDGRFDLLIYNAILRNIGVRPRDFEENTRDNLKIAELYKQVTSSVTVSEEEVFDEYKKRNEKVQISYVFVPPDAFKDEVSVTPDQVKQYYEDNKSDFLMPPTINVSYLTLPFPEKPEVTDKMEAEAAAGEETPQETADAEAAPASEEDPEAALEEEKDAVREKADALFRELLVNPNIEEAAAENGLTVQTTGFFSEEQPNLTAGWSYDLLNELFQMKENEVGAPYETETGIFLVQIKEKKDSYIPAFEEAKDKARETLGLQEAKKIAEQKAEEDLETIKEELKKTKVKDFPKAAKALELEIHQTPTFNRGQYLPQIGISKEFQETAFKLTEEDPVSGVVETPKGYCLLHLDDYIPVEDSEYQKMREELAQELSDEKRRTAFSDFAAQLRIKANLVDNVSRLQEKA